MIARVLVLLVALVAVSCCVVVLLLACRFTWQHVWALAALLAVVLVVLWSKSNGSRRRNAIVTMALVALLGVRLATQSHPPAAAGRPGGQADPLAAGPNGEPLRSATAPDGETYTYFQLPDGKAVRHGWASRSLKQDTVVYDIPVARQDDQYRAGVLTLRRMLDPAGRPVCVYTRMQGDRFDKDVYWFDDGSNRHERSAVALTSKDGTVDESELAPPVVIGDMPPVPPLAGDKLDARAAAVVVPNLQGGTDPPRPVINHLVATKTAGTVNVRFDLYGQQLPFILCRLQLRLFDVDGNFLTQVVSAGTYTSDWYLHGHTASAPVLVHQTCNTFSYPVNRRDLRDAAILELTVSGDINQVERIQE